MKDPLSELRDEAQFEAYEYFNKNIRSLTKLPSGQVDPAARGLADNDVDAFRHAYVSGVFTQVHGESMADLLGRLNELTPPSIYSNSSNPGSKNMDLWNNSIGRKYGKKTKGRKALLKKIHEALKRGELITDPSDAREYRGAKSEPKSVDKPIVTVSEDKNSRNKEFYDVIKEESYSLEEFLAQIQAGEYPGYTIKQINGKPTPVSKPDKKSSNNLG